MSGKKKESHRSVNKKIAQIAGAIEKDNEVIAKEQEESLKPNASLEKAVKNLDKAVKKQADKSQGVYITMVQDNDGVIVAGGGSVESLSTLFASAMMNNEMLKTALTQAVVMLEMDNMSEDEIEAMMAEVKPKTEA